MELLNKNAEDFIENSKRCLINYYKKHLKEDTKIKEFIKGLSINLDNIVEQNSYILENNYESLLGEKFKKKFVNSFTKVMNEQTQDMIDTVNNLKVDIKMLFDDLFTLNIESVLNETNNKMYETLDSIKEYREHFKSFQIPKSLINFINNYGKNVIQPSYTGLEALINRETKNLTLSNLNETAKRYENKYNEEKFIELRNKIYSSIKDDNIESISNAINETHGIEKYPYLLRKEIDKIDRRNLRILEGKETDNDTIVEESAENSLQKALNKSENTRKYIDSFENFEIFKEIIENNIINLNFSFKNANQSIDDSFSADNEVELNKYIHNKLEKLYNLSLGYYNKIKESYNSLRNYIEDSISEIDDKLIQCANITYETIEKEFKNITAKYEDFEVDEDKVEDVIETMSNISSSQNTQFTTEADIQNLEKKYKFKFSLKTEGEGKIRTQKLFGGITNQMKPQKMYLEISEQLGNCSRDYQTIDIKFNNINYTSSIIYDTLTNIANLTTISNFDAFKYEIKRFIVEPSNINFCTDTMGVPFCFEDEEECNDPEQVNATLFLTYGEVINKTKYKIVNY